MKLIKAEKPKILSNINYYWDSSCVDIKEIIEKERKKNRHRSYGHKKEKKCINY